MTVTSLWTVLDEAGCGKAVGAKQMVERNDTSSTSQRANPWNYNETNSTIIKEENRMSLAVDLSIWICEALMSTAMSENHADPALHLVFTRTTRLLSMGIKLVVVVEGKRRVRGSEGERDTFRKRRSGTAFWKACQSCEEMLRILGVPVVRAKAEGEALCALLNQRGIVDGVISNDGDCLLFGAKVVYTRFSLDNLDKSLVIRYDVSELRGCLQNDEKKEELDGDDEAVVSLKRGDLISFALLTGSDLAGDGLPKVGHKKAIRFIKQCKLDYPLTSSTAAIDELKSWARTASASRGQDTTIEKTQERCCSLCCHPGDKRSHLKHGCEQCGTQPGEPCFASSVGDKFRNSLRLKALAMVPKFDPVFVMEAYMNPNDNQVPIVLLGETGRSLRMSVPSLGDMMNFPHVIKGQSVTASKDYVKKTVARLLARAQLANHTKPARNHASRKNRLSREKPVPTAITRKLVHNKTSCYEISWVVKATTTDSDGNEIDGYEFSTIEARELVETRHPDLVQQFVEMEKEQAKQGDAEVNRRRDFVDKLLQGNVAQVGPGGQQPKQKGRRGMKKRSTFFGNEVAVRPRKVSMNTRLSHHANGGDDVHNLMAVVNDSFKTKKGRDIVVIRAIHGNEENSIVSELTEEPELFAKTRTDTNPIQDKQRITDALHVQVGKNDKGPPQDSLTPIDPLVPKLDPLEAQQYASPRIELNPPENKDIWKSGKRNLFGDDYQEPSTAAKRLCLSVLEPVQMQQTMPRNAPPQRDLMTAATPALRSPIFTQENYSTATSQVFLYRGINAETPLSRQLQFTSPTDHDGQYRSIVCDMGIQVAITPLISAKYI